MTGPPPARFIIIGAGAIGASLAQAILPRARVIIADADPAVRDHFSARGVQSLGPAELPAFAASDGDLAILAVRSTILPAALAFLPAALPALCIANGINFRLAASRPAPTLFGCADFAATIDRPGVPRSTQRGGLTFPSMLPACQALAAALAGSPIVPHAVPDSTGHVWSKALLNASLDPIAALTGRTLGGVFAHRPAFLLLRRLLREGLAVARAAGITLQPVQGTHPAIMDRVFHTPGLNRIAAAIAARKARSVDSTMLADLRAARPTEIESLCAVIADEAHRRGVAAPAHRAVTALFRDLLARPRPATEADIRAILAA